MGKGWAIPDKQRQGKARQGKTGKAEVTLTLILTLALTLTLTLTLIK